MVVPLVFYLGEGCLAAEIGAKLLSLLMGICFLDAARFREKCFCVGFIRDDFAPPRTLGKHRFRGSFSWLLPSDL